MTKTVRGIVYTASTTKGETSLVYHVRQGSRLICTMEKGFANEAAAMDRAEEIATTNYNPYEFAA